MRTTLCGVVVRSAGPVAMADAGPETPICIAAYANVPINKISELTDFIFIFIFTAGSPSSFRICRSIWFVALSSIKFAAELREG